jgi:hypothetical protein
MIRINGGLKGYRDQQQPPLAPKYWPRKPYLSDKPEDGR